MSLDIFIQARMSSRRLPGKVLKKINNLTILELIVKELANLKRIRNIVVLTSKLKSDDPIDKLCKKKKILVYRSNLKNVYKRYVDAINFYNCKSFCRINADSPLIDYKLIQIGINTFLSKKYDIVTNCFLRTFPKGQSFEIIYSNIFLKNFIKLDKYKYFEHIFLYYYKNNKDYKIYNFKNKKNLGNINYSVDTLKDLKFIRKNFKLIKK